MTRHNYDQTNSNKNSYRFNYSNSGRLLEQQSNNNIHRQRPPPPQLQSATKKIQRLKQYQRTLTTKSMNKRVSNQKIQLQQPPTGEITKTGTTATTDKTMGITIQLCGRVTGINLKQLREKKYLSLLISLNLVLS